MGKTILSHSEKGQKEYYDKIASEYDRYHTNPHALKYRYSCYDQMLGDIDFKGLMVLDAMCGGGDVTSYLVKKGAIVTGLDISKPFCRIYKGRFKDCDIVCSSILKTGFQSSCFDAVVIGGGLHHLHPLLDRGINEISRILKPGGYFCFYEPNAESFLDFFRKLWYRMDKRHFQKSEKSINIGHFKNKYGGRFEVIKTRYGGNLAYLFITQAMIFRIPTGLIKYYAPFFLSLERIINRLQNRFFSCWVFCVMRKRR